MLTSEQMLLTMALVLIAGITLLIAVTLDDPCEERGRTGLPAKRLAALANALHCQPIDLLMLPGTDVPREAPPDAADTG